MTTAGGTLTLEELEREAGRLLEEAGLLEAQADGRVAGVPDARTIRYYQTLGLVDRPEYAGREARYGRRHALQLVAIKALQSASLPLAEVQRRLYGKSNAELEALLRSVRALPRRRPAPAVLWRELAIEPGLKVMIQDGWSPSSDAVDRIRAALEAHSHGGTNGGMRR